MFRGNFFRSMFWYGRFAAPATTPDVEEPQPTGAQAARRARWRMYRPVRYPSGSIPAGYRKPRDGVL